MIAITRRYSFSASHRLHSPELTPEENAVVFGKCNNPFGHGHNYELSVTVAGEVDAKTGLIVSIASLDWLVQDTVLRRFAYRYLNVDVSEFVDLVPTTENVAIVIAGILRRRWDEYIQQPDAYLSTVHVQETERNGFEILLGNPANSNQNNLIGELISVR